MGAGERWKMAGVFFSVSARDFASFSPGRRGCNALRARIGCSVFQDFVIRLRRTVDPEILAIARPAGPSTKFLPRRRFGRDDNPRVVQAGAQQEHLKDKGLWLGWPVKSFSKESQMVLYVSEINCAL